MSKLPRISGVKVLKILTKFFGFRTLRQRGSHVTITNDILFSTVPLHPELDRGTLLAILKDTKTSREEFMKYV